MHMFKHLFVYRTSHLKHITSTAMVLESKQKGEHSKCCIRTGKAQWFALVFTLLNILLCTCIYVCVSIATSFALGKSLTVVTGTL